MNTYGERDNLLTKWVRSTCLMGIQASASLASLPHSLAEGQPLMGRLPLGGQLARWRFQIGKDIAFSIIILHFFACMK
jgi:hypothetical protein